MQLVLVVTWLMWLSVCPDLLWLVLIVTWLMWLGVLFTLTDVTECPGVLCPLTCSLALSRNAPLPSLQVFSPVWTATKGRDLRQKSNSLQLFVNSNNTFPFISPRPPLVAIFRACWHKDAFFSCWQKSPILTYTRGCHGDKRTVLSEDARTPHIAHQPIISLYYVIYMVLCNGKNHQLALKKYFFITIGLRLKLILSVTPEHDFPYSIFITLFMDRICI